MKPPLPGSRHGVINAGRHEVIEVIECETHHFGCTVIRSVEAHEQAVHVPTTAIGVLINILRDVPQR